MTTTPFTNRNRVTRRRMLGAALAVGAAVPLAAAGPAWAAQGTPAPTDSDPARLTLPEPTGPRPVGAADLHLVDTSRPDPGSPGQFRRLMTGVWYPAPAAPTGRTHRTSRPTPAAAGSPRP